MAVTKVQEFVVTLVHLALWAQLGVLTRIYLNKFFADGCRNDWGVCLTSEGVPLLTSCTQWSGRR